MKKKISVFVTIVVFIVVGYMFFPSDYSYKLDGMTFKMKSKVYSDTVDLKKVSTLELVEGLPDGNLKRTNGGNPPGRLYGNFKIEGIGPVRLYIVKNVKSVIHMKTDEKEFYFNDKDENSTKKLYEDLEKLTEK